MQDAQSARPLVGDRYAEPFLGDEGKQVFNLFRDFRYPNGSNLTRCHLIDQLVQANLRVTPQRRVILVGAGFDSRAFRLSYGRWIEIDEASIIARKEAIAPARNAANPLQRIAIDFARVNLANVLAPFATREQVIVIVEGVLMYLEQTQVEQLVLALGRVFPNHLLICDLMQRRFFTKFSGPLHEVIKSLGARFRWTVDDPEQRIAAMGYRVIERISIALRAAELRRIPIPAFVVRWLIPALRDGYGVYVFEHKAPP